MEQDVEVDSRKLLKGLERETGIEPATSSLGSWHSTAELLPPYDRTCQAAILKILAAFTEVIYPCHLVFASFSNLAESSIRKLYYP